MALFEHTQWQGLRCKPAIKRGQLFILFLILISLLLGACSPSQVMLSCEPSGDAAVFAILPKSKDLSIDIAIDGTASMQGFVNGVTNSRYIQTMQLLDTVSSTAWAGSQTKVNYFRFGTKQQKIERGEFRRAQLPDFYRIGADFTTSDIAAALPTKAEQRLSLIVTDLYQQDADVNLIQQQLTSKYLQQGFAVGVLALRSEFNGTIYDVGLQRQQFTYQSGTNPAKYHPFYILMLGNYADIQHFYNEFKKTREAAALLQPGQGEFAIFYARFADPVSTLNLAQLPEPLPKNVRRVKSLNDGRVMVRVRDNQAVELLRFTQGAAAASLDYTIPYAPLANLVPVNLGDISVNTSATRLQGKAEALNIAQANSLAISNVKVAANQLSFKTDFNPSSLENGIYNFVVRLSPQELQSPAWWEKWNTVEGQLDGSKTHNLSRFLEALRSGTNALIRDQKPPIAHICFGIQKG